MRFKDADDREILKQYFLPTVEIEDYNIMVDGRNFLDQPIKNNLKRMIKLKRCQWVKLMITQLNVYEIIPISKTITN